MLYPDEGDAREVIARIAEETGLPAADPVRFGGDGLWATVHEAVDTLPWMARAVPMAPSQHPQQPRQAQPQPGNASAS
jgi:hypothetical protein